MKKNMMIILGTVVVAIALVICLVFVLGGKGENVSPKLPDLTGSWTVAAVYTKDVPVFTENQYMVFKDGTAAVYKDTTDSAYASSTYSINEAGQLLLPDISREYKIDRKTDRCVRLYESTEQYMLLIKNKDDEIRSTAYTTEDLEGKWTVAMKGDQLNNGEVMEFSGGTLRYYKGGSAEPFATADFVLENGVIKAESLGMSMRCYCTSEASFALVEESGIVWELVK